MSEWIVDTTRYERDYGITDHTQALIALSVDLTTLLGCEPVVELVRCRDCVSLHRDEVGTWCCLRGTGFYRRPTGEGDYCSKGVRRVQTR